MESSEDGFKISRISMICRACERESWDETWCMQHIIFISSHSRDENVSVS